MEQVVRAHHGEAREQHLVSLAGVGHQPGRARRAQLHVRQLNPPVERGAGVDRHGGVDLGAQGGNGAPALKELLQPRLDAIDATKREAAQKIVARHLGRHSKDAGVPSRAERLKRALSRGRG